MYEVLRYAGALVTLFFLLGLPFESAAQDDYQEGFVVTNANDTLYGTVRDRKTGAFGKLYKKIKFKGKRGKSKYSPKEIISYNKGGVTFETMQLIRTGHFFDDKYEVSAGGDFLFLKVIEKGYLTYYQLEFEDGESDFIDSIDLFKKRDGEMLIRATQGIFGLRRKSLMRFFNDCPPLVKKIERKEFKYPIEVSSFYNIWKSGQL